jgi:short subunit dehydrogenase-like uncharacterized protein
VSDPLLVYGSYGYTGRLVVAEAVERGLDPVIAGRTAEKVERQAVEYGLDHEVFSLSTPEVVTDRLEDVSVVLNCAGPFERTAGPLVDACVETGTDYLDITGELGVFESLAARDDEAEAAGVTVLPGVGFDVVPTDSLAAHLADRLPDATDLRLGFRGLSTLSPGTAHTAVGALGESGAVRREGRIQPVPQGYDARTIDFGRGPTSAVAIPWGDVSTAYHTTGIPNVTVYAAQSPRTIRFLGLSNRLDWLLGSAPVQSLLHRAVDRFVEGPDAEERATRRTYLWGRASNEDEAVVSRMETPESYEFTKRSATHLARRTRDGDAPTGFQTPASAFGKDVALGVEGVERTDE